MIWIDTESMVPIYTQLIYQIKQSIIREELQRGQSMPSVRSLAGDLGVNLHTINKAYKLLVEEGVLVQEKKGFKVNTQLPVVTNEQNQQAIIQKLDELLVDSMMFDMDLDELIRVRSKMIKGCDKNDLDD